MVLYKSGGAPAWTRSAFEAWTLFPWPLTNHDHTMRPINPFSASVSKSRRSTSVPLADFLTTIVICCVQATDLLPGSLHSHTSSEQSFDTMASTLMLRSTAPLVGKFQYACTGRRARALTRPVLAAKGGDSYQVSVEARGLLGIVSAGDVTSSARTVAENRAACQKSGRRRVIRGQEERNR